MNKNKSRSTVVNRGVGKKGHDKILKAIMEMDKSVRAYNRIQSDASTVQDNRLFYLFPVSLYCHTYLPLYAIISLNVGGGGGLSLCS